MKDEALAARCGALRLVVSDVDGVLTDGTILLLPGGQEAKAFHTRDGLAVVLAHRAGLKIALLSGRSSEAVSRRARELGIGIVRQGVSDKGAAFAEILAAEGLRPQEAAYIGDDVNDLPAMLQAGLSAAPADAAFEVRAQAYMVTEARGGHGSFREFVEAILRARGRWDSLMETIGTAAMPPDTGRG
jgi:3-deoxy-D-manno-octulosonate 8-phosphate phosphatase (KDO 8-P phosphatase)